MSRPRIRNISPADQRRYNGVTYGSKLEKARAMELDALKEQGVVVEWVRQPVFYLGVPENKYVADFLVIAREPNPGGYIGEALAQYDDIRVWVEECKGFEDARAKKNKKLWRAYGNLPLAMVKWKGKRIEVAEWVRPEGNGQ